MVGMRGLEPPRCHHHRLLRPARLPVPPHPRDSSNIRTRSQGVNLPRKTIIATKRELDCDGAGDNANRRYNGRHNGTWDSPRNTRTDWRSTAANTDRSCTGPRNKAADNCTSHTGKCSKADADKRHTVSADTPRCDFAVNARQPTFS